MTVSETSRAALELLAASAGALLRDLEALEPGSDPDYGPLGAVTNLRRYLAILRKGRSDDDVSTALKGANLLTTVNKGVADSDLGEAGKALGAKAFAVARNASDAGRSLRADAGMPF